MGPIWVQQKFVKDEKNWIMIVRNTSNFYYTTELLGTVISNNNLGFRDAET